ncbi:hypothetical protein [Nonomuraea sp. NPDC050202]|jgi:hypothetical protein|uniref:hypothetical protein n=1 Tax=Nonomuraea sp. NPDC050202 TaxID=3155035 RepID=UPI0033C1831E
MYRPARLLTVSAAATAFTALLIGQAQLTDLTALAAAVVLMLVASATTVHAILRPAQRRPVDEAYTRSYERVSARLDRMR